MSQISHCPVCGQRCGPGTRNPTPNGMWCALCEGRLRAIGGATSGEQYARDHQVAHSLSRDHLAAYIHNTKDPLETLNMCIKWLNRASPASYSNPAFHPAAGLNDPFRYKKEDFDPDSSPPFDIEGHRHSQQLYMAALSAFRIYGPCKFSLCWLRHAHNVDKKVLPFLLGNKDTGVHPWAENYHTNMYKPTWADTPGALDWLRASVEDVELRACDGIGCKKVEDRPKAFKSCGRCRFTLYCGVECQKADWTRGNHKTWCATMPKPSGKS